MNYLLSIHFNEPEKNRDKVLKKLHVLGGSARYFDNTWMITTDTDGISYLDKLRNILSENDKAIIAEVGKDVNTYGINF